MWLATGAGRSAIQHVIARGGHAELWMSRRAIECEPNGPAPRWMSGCVPDRSDDPPASRECQTARSLIICTAADQADPPTRSPRASRRRRAASRWPGPARICPFSSTAAKKEWYPAPDQGRPVISAHSTPSAAVTAVARQVVGYSAELSSGRATDSAFGVVVPQLRAGARVETWSVESTD